MLRFGLYGLSGILGLCAARDDGALGTMLLIASIGVLLAGLSIPEALRDRREAAGVRPLP